MQDYRFSEDLDFTLTEDASINPQEIVSYLLEAFSIGSRLFGLCINDENIDIRPFPDKNGLFIQVKIPFQSPLRGAGSLPKVKLDLSKGEIIVDSPKILPLIHPYSDAPMISTRVKCYGMDEIFAEKCRALVERTRPRDLYDVVNLYERFYRNAVSSGNLKGIMKKKFHFKNLKFPHDLTSLGHDAFSETREDWQSMLSHQLFPLNPMETYLEIYPEICEFLENL